MSNNEMVSVPRVLLDNLARAVESGDVTASNYYRKQILANLSEPVPRADGEREVLPERLPGDVGRLNKLN